MSRTPFKGSGESNGEGAQNSTSGHGWEAPQLPLHDRRAHWTGGAGNLLEGEKKRRETCSEIKPVLCIHFQDRKAQADAAAQMALHG